MKQEAIDKYFNAPMLGVFSKGGCDLVDKPFGILRSCPNDALNKVANYGKQVPVVLNAMTARAATAQDVIDFGTDITAVDDLVVIMRFHATAQNAAIKKVLGIYQLDVAQSFEDNKVSGAYDMYLRAYQTTGVGFVQYTAYDREIEVTPSCGANGNLGFTVFPAVSAQQLRYDIALDSFGDPTQQRDAFFDVLDMGFQAGVINTEVGLIDTVVFVFKGQGLIDQSITVMPAVASEAAPGLLGNLFFGIAPKE